MQKLFCLLLILSFPVYALAQETTPKPKQPSGYIGKYIEQLKEESESQKTDKALVITTGSISKQSPEQVNQFIKEAYEKGRRITVQAKMQVSERWGKKCVLVEKVRHVNGIVTSFSPNEAFTIREYRSFAPFMDDTEGGGFQIQHTICFSKVVAVKKQNQFLRVMRDTGETVGFIGGSAALVPTIPVVLILARAGKIDW